jgi:DNA-directed RNA polymerase subunit L
LENLNPVISLNDLLNKAKSVNLAAYQIDPNFLDADQIDDNVSGQVSAAVKFEDDDDTS